MNRGPWSIVAGGSLWLVVSCGGKVEGGSAFDGNADPDAGRPPATDSVDAGADPRTSSPDAVCGNGRLELGEACDGADLNGDTCGSVTMLARPDGVLRCSAECAFDISACRAPDPTGGVAGIAGGGTMGTGGYMMGGGGLAFTGGASSGGTTNTTGSTGGTSTGGSAGSSLGDPHVFTADGVEYDFQAVGEFVLLEDRDDPGFVVQVRQTPYRGYPNLSVNAAVAMRVQGNRVGIYAGRTLGVRVDGSTMDVDGGLQLSEGGTVERKGAKVTVTWPSGEAVAVSAGDGDLLNVSYVPGHSSKRRLHGLLGRPDGDPDNDLTTREGRRLVRPDVDAVYDQFGESFRIRAAESLFDYGPGESTESYTDRAFPYGGREPPKVTWAELGRARALCVARGVAGDDALRACALDVAVTGDPAFAIP